MALRERLGPKDQLFGCGFRHPTGQISQLKRRSGLLFAEALIAVGHLIAAVSGRS